MRNRTALIALAASLFAATALPAAAQVAGTWHVTGDISGHGFVLDCHFTPDTARFGGACTEMGGSDAQVKPGKVHQLSQGSFSGQQVRWAYPASVMFMPIDIAFSGTVTGNAMSGITTAAGRSGKFTGTRK